MKMLRKALVIAALGAAGISRLIAQVPLTASIEGTISSITYNSSQSVTMIVMGVNVNVAKALADAGDVISPSADLSLETLAGKVVLPGRGLQQGFEGGTAIVEGVWQNNQLVASSVFVEPAENIMLGQVTAANPLRINGVEIAILPEAGATAAFTSNLDARIVPGHLLPRLGPTGLRHEVGIPLASVKANVLAAAEGYFADGKFNAFVVDAADGVALTDSDQLAITRAQVRERTPNTTRGDEYDIRGGIHLRNARARQIAVYRIDTLPNAAGVPTTTYTRLGAAVATIPDAVNPKFGTWRLTGVTPTVRVATNPLGTAPSRIVVYLVPLTATGANGTSPTSTTSFPAGAVLSAESTPDLIP